MHVKVDMQVAAWGHCPKVPGDERNLAKRQRRRAWVKEIKPELVGGCSPLATSPRLSQLCLKFVSAAVSTSGLAVKGIACQLSPRFCCSLCLKWELNVAGSSGKERRTWFIYSTLASPMAEGPPWVTRLAVSGHCHRHKHLLWLIA